MNCVNPDAETYFDAFGINEERACELMTAIMTEIVKLVETSKGDVITLMETASAVCNNKEELGFTMFKLGEWLEACQDPLWQIQVIGQFKADGNKIIIYPDKPEEISITGHGGEA